MASIPFIDPYDVLARITTSLMTGKLNLATVVMLLPIPYKQIGGGQALVRWMRVMAKGDVWASAAMSGLQVEHSAGMKSRTISVVEEPTTLVRVL